MLLGYEGFLVIAFLSQDTKWSFELLIHRVVWLYSFLNYSISTKPDCHSPARPAYRLAIAIVLPLPLSCHCLAIVLPLSCHCLANASLSPTHSPFRAVKRPFKWAFSWSSLERKIKVTRTGLRPL